MNFYEITIQRISHLSINFEIITTQQQKKKSDDRYGDYKRYNLWKQHNKEKNVSG